MSESKKFLLVEDFEFKEDDEPKTWADRDFPFKKVSGVLNVTICGETHKYHTQGYTYCDYDKYVEALNKRDEKIAKLESELNNLREILGTGPRKISDIEDKEELEKECIGRFRRMWTYISELSAEEHRCVSKEEAIKTLYPNDFDDLAEQSFCYLCYYRAEVKCGCDSCPVKWNGLHADCGRDSCFSKWVDAKNMSDYAEASKYAAEIATLPLKKKRLYLKSPYKHRKNSFYGYVGEKTSMKDDNGDVLHVGDVVEIRLDSYEATQIVVHPYNDHPFIMGIRSSCEEDGWIDMEWSVKLTTSYKELKLGDEVCNFKIEEAYNEID